MKYDIRILKENFNQFLQDETINEGMWGDILAKGKEKFNNFILNPLKQKLLSKLDPLFKQLELLKSKNPNATIEEISQVISGLKTINLEGSLTEILNEADMYVNTPERSKTMKFLMSAIVSLILFSKIISIFPSVDHGSVDDLVKDQVKSKTGVENVLDSDPTKTDKSPTQAAGFVDGDDIWDTIKGLANKGLDAAKSAASYIGNSAEKITGLDLGVDDEDSNIGDGDETNKSENVYDQASSHEGAIQDDKGNIFVVSKGVSDDMSTSKSIANYDFNAKLLNIQGGDSKTTVDGGVETKTSSGKVSEFKLRADLQKDGFKVQTHYKIFSSTSESGKTTYTTYKIFSARH